MQAEPPLAYLLLQGSRWFDSALLAGLAARGWRLTPAQSLVFAHLEPGGTRPAALARRLGTSRQATADLLAGLERLGVVEVVDDPGSRRGRLARLTPEGERLASAAADRLAQLERELAGRIGDDAVTRLRAALTGAWGEPPAAEE